MEHDVPFPPAPARPRRARPVPVRVLLLGLLGVALVLAGCSSGPSTTASAGASTTTTAAGAGGFAAYQACLARHGVTLPDRGTGGRPGPGAPGGQAGSRPAGGTRPPISLPEGVTQAEMDAAQQACAASRPTGGPGVDASALNAYTSCLADHGVAVSTTTTTAGTSTPTGRGPDGFDRNDPNFAAADQACSALLPARGAGASTSTTAAP